MGWDGAGGYNRQRNFSADASAGIKILASAMDQEIDDVASAMQLCWARDGQNTPTGNIPMGGYRLTNVGNAASVSDYITAKQVIENVPIYVADTNTSADKVSVSATFFTSVSAGQAPAGGTKIMARTLSHKSAPVMYFSGHSANINFHGGPRIDGLVSGAVYEFTYSSAGGVWETGADRLYPKTAAETAAGVTPTNYQYEPGVFERYGAAGDDATDDSTALANALLQAGQTDGSPARAGKTKRIYYIAANTLVVPDDATLDISGVGIRTTNAAAITMGSESTIVADGENSTIESSGASGTAISKTSTASVAPWYIIGFPRVFPTLAGQAGSVGLDFSAAYRGRFQVRVEDYETQVLGGEGTPTPQTYYNTLEVRSNNQNGGTTGVKLQQGCNGTVLLNPEINGSSNLTYYIDVDSTAGLVIDGGYIEGSNDVNATRGIRITDASNTLVSGTVVEISTSSNNNFALEVAGSSISNLTFQGIGFGGGWGSSAKLGTASGGGLFNFFGGAPTNMVAWLGASSFTASESSGVIRASEIYGTDQINVSASKAADYAALFSNTADGPGAYFDNNSGTTTAARAVLVLNRVGGAGCLIAGQNNGAGAPGIYFGSGSPEGAQTAPVGSFYSNTAGGAATTLYVKTSGAGNTGWTAK